MRKFLIVILFLTCLLFGKSLDACSCVHPPPPKEALGEADYVFSGMVMRHEMVDSTRPYPRNSGDSFELVKYFIAVERIWKGSTVKAIEVITRISTASCGFPFQDSQRFMIYAYKGFSDSSHLYTNLCSRTKFIVAADEDIKELGEGIKVQ